MVKVLFSDYEYETIEPEKEIIKDAFPEVEFVERQCRTEEEVMEAARGVDAIVNQYVPISRRVIETFDQCIVIARYGIGVDTIDLDAAKEKGIVVCNVQDYCIDEVSDHAMTLLLGAARKTTFLNNHIKNRDWDFSMAVPIYRLKGRVIGLIGFGKIPQLLSKKAKAFGLKVVTYDPYVSEEVLNDFGVVRMDLNELCAKSDFISVHVPSTKATIGLVGEEQFNLMKKEAIIINTARGNVINEEAMVAALTEGQITGAALDVFECEPLPEESPLLRLDNVILSPHIAWYSEESQLELKRQTALNVVEVLKGNKPKFSL